MTDSIIDTSVLIDCLRGRANAISYLRLRPTPTTHVMVAAELLAGARDKREQALIESFLSPFQVIPPDESDALTALDLYRRFRLSHGVDWPDCQIAATALRLGVEVHTLNLKHFSAIPNLLVMRPY